jgi:hypothetical protein
MELLPPDHERDELLDELSDLITAAGAETFLAAPILFPDDATFPDAWDGGPIGVYRLTRRMQTYAGLGELDLNIEMDHFSETKMGHDAYGRPSVVGHEGVAGWFAGIEDNRCYFGVDLAQLSTPGSLAGTMAHEVCHAYRAWLGITTSERLREELRTDLTSIYLGFGILTANASLMFRSGSTEGLGSYWQTQQGGYMSPQSMCFVLAAQVVARGLAPAERKRIASHLETNQAACFRAACDSLSRDALLERLGLPLPALHPRVRAIADVEFDEQLVEGLLASETEASDAPVDESPTGRLERRVPNGVVVIAGWLAGGTAAVLLAGTNPGLAVGVGLAAPLLAWLVAPRRLIDVCADRSCAAILPVDATRCPTCRRVIAARIASEADRLDLR